MEKENNTNPSEKDKTASTILLLFDVVNMEIQKIKCKKCGKEIVGLTKSQLEYLLKIHQMSKNCKKVVK